MRSGLMLDDVDVGGVDLFGVCVFCEWFIGE